MKLTRTNEEEAAIAREPELAALANELWASAQPATIDPVFRAALRAELLGTEEPFLYAPLITPINQWFVAFRGNHLRLISSREEGDFVAEARRELGEQPSRCDAVPARLARRVLAAIEGRRQPVDPLELAHLTAFQRAVLAQTQRIPRGEVRSYAWIAREVGQPKAVRAVGTALAHNPLPLVIPCHRVIRTDGELGNYSGGGTQVKERLLAYEGVDLPHLQDLRHAGLRFTGSRTTKIFCLPTCYSGKHMQSRNRVFFHSEAEAREQGYRPCKLCRPAV